MIQENAIAQGGMIKLQGLGTGQGESVLFIS
jgi:hypothetical protein